MKAAEDFFAAFRWEETLNVADEKDQDTQQQGDFDDIINKELKAPDPAISCIETNSSKQSTN